MDFFLTQNITGPSESFQKIKILLITKNVKSYLYRKFFKKLNFHFIKGNLTKLPNSLNKHAPKSQTISNINKY